MIRRATDDDLPQILALGARHHKAAAMPGAFDGDAFHAFARGVIGGAGAVFISKRGMIGGVLAPSYAAPTHKMAVELFWWAEDCKGNALRRAFEAWARDEGASEVRMSAVVHHRGEVVGKMLARAGYRPIEVSYAKEVA